MNYLLDTNIVSELLSAKPDKNVEKWLVSIPSENLFLSVITLGEIRKGIELLAAGKKKTQLMVWLEHELPQWFTGRIVSIDQAVADRWGCIMASKKKIVPAIDALLAATALTYNFMLVTRNEKDFQISGLEILNPFQY